MTDLQHHTQLSDLEKAYVWTEIANGKTEGDVLFGLGGKDGEYFINNEGVNPDVIDDWFLNGDATQVHTVVGFTDGYHGVLGGPAGDNGVAEQTIYDHENERNYLPDWVPDGVWGTFNDGDQQASLAMVDSFRAFREEGFDGFAETWRERMLGSGPTEGDAFENAVEGALENPVREGLEGLEETKGEFSEAWREIGSEIDEAYHEIIDGNAIEVVTESIEGSLEIGAEVIEGTLETGAEVIEGTIETGAEIVKGGIDVLDKGMDLVNPFD